MEVETPTSKHHIMLLPMPAQGHMNPMLQFAKRLASKGLRVTLVGDATATTTNSIQAQTSLVNLEYINYRFEEIIVPEKVDMDAFLAHLKLRVSQSLSELIWKQENSGCPVTVIVYDSLTPWVLDMVKEFGLLGAAFFTQSCAVCAIYYHMYQGTLDIPKEETSCLVSIPSLPIMDVKDLPSFIYDMGAYPSVLDLVTTQLSNVEMADWILLNSFGVLEHKVCQ